MVLQLDLSLNELGARGRAALLLGAVKKAFWARWLWTGSALVLLLLCSCYGNNRAIALPLCCYSALSFCLIFVFSPVKL
jgi:hypothetical protein